MSEKILCAVNILILAVFITLKLTLPAVNFPTAAKTEVYDDLLKQDDWALFIISEESPIAEDYSFNLAEISYGHFMDERAAPYAVKMLENARDDGVTLNVISSYRDIDRQSKNFSDYVNRLLKEGYSREKAITITAAQIAHPGASEHNAGLALDILTADWWVTHNDVTADFENTPEFAWLKNNAWKYGFIIRYPENKQEITGITYEPWHFRFVGVFRARQMRLSGLCLEEYTDALTADFTGSDFSSNKQPVGFYP